MREVGNHTVPLPPLPIGQATLWPVFKRREYEGTLGSLKK